MAIASMGVWMALASRALFLIQPFEQIVPSLGLRQPPNMLQAFPQDLSDLL